ncbi:Crp/Fnr family transcriptional regulator [Jiella sonneratiae]|uniref:Crp/Fnr family transcriptional regulator n=1 Tax=Jiella sonneratiae TaxID=2816856 RepID=UPI001FD9D016|nr:Crp/Fnr family transcriptional regulator [Jiella sonneratiae]
MLLACTDEDLAAIAPGLVRIELARGENLVMAMHPIDAIYFPESCICSLVLTSKDGRQGEIGVFGNEGINDGSLLAGIDRVPHESFIQVPGICLKMPAERFQALCLERPGLYRLVQRWTHIMAVQVAQTAMVNVNYNVEERLARWLLMCHDRIDGDVIELTHDFLGTMLSVRRSTVTLSTHILEGAGIIRARRGRITIRNREALIAIADGAYGNAEAEYERLIGSPRSGAA